MVGRLLAPLAMLLCGCSLMLPPGYGSGDADAGGDADAVEMTGDGIEDVPEDQDDEDGAPMTPCLQAYLEGRHYGCEFWTVPLPIENLPGAGTWELGLILTNVSDDEVDVMVLLDGAEIEERHIAIESSVHIGVPLIGTQSYGLPADIWNSLLVTDGAYYIITSGPVAAWQFNPRRFESGSTIYAMHTSSTLLLPEPSLSTSYRVLGVPPHSMYRAGGSPYEKRASYISIVGTSDVTNLTITAGGTIASGSGIEETPAGGEIVTTIGTGEVLHLASGVPPNCESGRPGYVVAGGNWYCDEAEYDLSGTHISASQPVAVFVGATAVNVPYDVETFDHIAEQLPPSEAMGVTFVTGPMSASGEMDVHTIVKVMAAENGTHVHLDPVMDGYEDETLNEGEVLTFTLTDSVIITSTHPVLAAQFLVGSEYGSGGRPIGDPAMTWLVPVERWTDSYAFEIPQEFGEGMDDSEVYIHVVCTPGSPVHFDGEIVEVADFVPVGGSGTYDMAWLYVDEGVHTVEGESVIGVHLWGMGPGVGIAHPVGAMLPVP